MICKAVSADRNGIAASRWCLDVRNRTKPFVFSHKVAPGVDGGEPGLCDGCGFYFVWRSSGPQCQRCAEVIFQRFNALCHCVWWSRLAVCIGMAAATRRQGDLWNVEIERHPTFPRIKWLPASMGGMCDGCGFYFIWRSTGPHCRRCAEVTFERFNALYHCVWSSRLAVCIGMAAATRHQGDVWVLELHETLCFLAWSGSKRRWGEPGLCEGCGFYHLALGWSPLPALRGGDLWKIQRAVPLRLAGSLHWNGCSDASSRWCLGVRNRTKPFSRIKWLPASIGGTWFARRVQLLLGSALGWSPLSALRGGDLWKIQCAVPLCLVIQACSLHWNGCSDASSSWCLGVRNRTKPFVSRIKWLPALGVTSFVRRVRLLT